MICITTTTPTGQQTEFLSDEQTNPIRLIKSDEATSLAFITSKGEQVIISLTPVALLALSVPAN